MTKWLEARVSENGTEGGRLSTPNLTTTQTDAQRKFSIWDFEEEGNEEKSDEEKLFSIPFRRCEIPALSPALFSPIHRVIRNF